MEDKRLSDLLVNIKQLDNGRQRITISYKDEKGDNYNEQYQCEGYLKYFQPDANSVVIQEIKASKDRNYPMIIIFSRLEKGHSLNYFCLTDEPIINENLKDIKKMIIRQFGLEAVYSYQYGYLTSAWYDKIIYDEKTQTFQVEVIMETAKGIVRLVGELDTDGHLIDDTMYIPQLSMACLVDEDNLYESLESYKNKIERMLTKKENTKEKKAYVEYEYQLYLNRKRKKVVWK